MILTIVVVAIGAVVVGLGLLDPILPLERVATVKRQRAVALRATGSYTQIPEVFTAVKSAFPVAFESGQRVGWGVYFDKPGEKARWAVGFECESDSECESARKQLAENKGAGNVLVVDVAAGEVCWRTSMAIRTLLSPMINAWRAWPTILAWMEAHKVAVPPAVCELYDSVESVERFVVFENPKLFRWD